MTQVVYNKLSIFTIAYDIGINLPLKVQRLRLMANVKLKFRFYLCAQITFIKWQSVNVCKYLMERRW